MAKSTRSKELFTLLLVFIGVVVVSAAAVYYIGGARRVTPEAARQSPSPDAVLSAPEQRSTPAPQNLDDETFIDRLFGSQHNAIAFDLLEEV